MPSIPLYPSAVNDSKRSNGTEDPPPNALPQLLQTPSGLAIIELQGTINLPTSTNGTADEDGDAAMLDSSDDTSTIAQFKTEVGHLMFPDYSAARSTDDKAWMKRVYLYVGRHQRLTGEVKKLPKPWAVIRRREQQDEEAGDALEIVEIVKFKILFQSRPEPVGD